MSPIDSSAYDLVVHWTSPKPCFESLKDDFRLVPSTREALLALPAGMEYPSQSWTHDQCAEWMKGVDPAFAAVIGAWSASPPDDMEACVSKTDLTVEGVSVRVLTKKDASDLPTLMYLHGGGFAAWSCKDQAFDNYLTRLAALGKCTVVAVDYTLTPEQVFPRGLHDCTSVVKAAIAGNVPGVAAGKVCIAGDSAGGNLTIACALTASNEGWLQDIAGLYPICPYLDGEIKSEKYPSMMALDGYFLSEAFLIGVIKSTVQDEDQKYWITHPLLFPMNATDEDLKCLPMVKTIVFELDMIRDMGIAFHYRLKKLGVDSTLSIVAGGIHEQQLFTTHSPQITESSIHDLAQFVSFAASK